MGRIAVFGLGYVGSVTAAVLAGRGHHVVGVDRNPLKVQMINDGSSPVIEPGLGDLIASCRDRGSLEATVDAGQAMDGASLSVICVGTPSRSNGSLDLSYVRRAAADIGANLVDGGPIRHTVVVRSTMLPGSVEEEVIPVLEASSRLRAGSDFGVVFNPEFLREGSSLADYQDPPFTIIGAGDTASAEAVSALYAHLAAETFVVSIKTAEMVKYACNAFHGLKIAFANEIGNMCAVQGFDGRDVMEVFCRDTKLNISPTYLKPGYAFGGSCLPKDLRALDHHARRLDVAASVLESILPSNRHQIERAFDLVTRSGRRRVAVLGLSFKPGTDDLRESPVVELVERLIGKGYPVTVYDANVSLAELQGANRDYIEREIPHIASIMSDSLEKVIDGAEVVVVAHRSPEFVSALVDLDADYPIVDLVGVPEVEGREGYVGICW
ncbi:MAG: nucleotide sugar dehydrogenase [Acidimicrobiia bacterium]